MRLFSSRAQPNFQFSPTSLPLGPPLSLPGPFPESKKCKELQNLSPSLKVTLNLISDARTALRAPKVVVEEVKLACSRAIDTLVLCCQIPSCSMLALKIEICSSLGYAGRPCVCNNGQRDTKRNPGFTGDGKTCNTLEPCMINKIGAPLDILSSFQPLYMIPNRWKPHGRLLAWMHDASANRNSSGQHYPRAYRWSGLAAQRFGPMWNFEMIDHDHYFFQFWLTFIASWPEFHSWQLISQKHATTPPISECFRFLSHLCNCLVLVADSWSSVAAAFWGFVNLRTDLTPQWCHVHPSTTLTFGHVIQTITKSKIWLHFLNNFCSRNPMNWNIRLHIFSSFCRFCQLEMPVCSSYANGFLMNGLLFALILILASLS